MHLMKMTVRFSDRARITRVKSGEKKKNQRGDIEKVLSLETGTSLHYNT